MAIISDPSLGSSLVNNSSPQASLVALNGGLNCRTSKVKPDASPQLSQLGLNYLKATTPQNSNTAVLNAISQLVVNFATLLEKAFLLVDQALKIVADKNPEPTAPSTTPSPTAATPAAETPATTKKPTTLPASGEFLWKPVSDKDKKLAILLPSSVSKNATAVRILDPDGKQIEKGTYSGIGNGNRAHFRFKKAGSSYPDKAIVEIVLQNGNVKRVRIPETSQRYIK